ncbi:MAG TPA: carboxylating nicotinate-nucleotide diphosphorylase [Actinomycetota bacterium]|nr:carboxylating nicotinate-nucleotide diphosphorylase [Actinomycetota bacterium]
MNNELDLSLIRPDVERWLAEDVGRGDMTTSAVIPAAAHATARIEARESFTLAGLVVAGLCFEIVAGGRNGYVEFDPKFDEGSLVPEGAALARVEGNLRTILTAERTALNVLGRLSGIASLTADYARILEGTGARVVDTRKTTPGLRVLEKYAVRAGGGSNHRFGLDDGILIKDNHIAAAGGIGSAVRIARRNAHHGLRVEVEVEDLDGLDEAIAAGADTVLLDNMTVAEVEAAVARAGGRVLLEVSGGVNLDNAGDYARAGADLISVGALTHSVRSVDVALEVDL